MHLVVLGSGTSIPHPQRGTSGYALVADDGTVLLLECGPGSTRRWPSADLDFANVGAIAISHHHVDHCGDLAAVLFGRNVVEPPLESPITLVGPYPYIHVNPSPSDPNNFTLPSPTGELFSTANHDMNRYITSVGAGKGGTWNTVRGYAQQTDHDNAVLAKWLLHADNDPGWVQYCFQSLGRDVSGTAVHNPQQMKSYCHQAGSGEKECIYGAIRDVMNNNATDPRGAQFCNIVASQFRNYCYFGIGTILGTQHADSAGKRAACEQFDLKGEDLNQCLQGAGA